MLDPKPVPITTTTLLPRGDYIPALTITFTPAPACSSLHLTSCGGSSCYATLGLNDGTRLCMPGYPPADNNTGPLPEYTYSPGLYCPEGMTTVSSEPELGAAYCCYSDYQLDYYALAGGGVGHYCTATITSGSFVATAESGEGLVTSTFAFGPSQTAASYPVASGDDPLMAVVAGLSIFATGPAIFLTGQNQREDNGRPTSQPTPSGPAGTDVPPPLSPSVSVSPTQQPDPNTNTRTRQIGLIVGASAGGLLLLLLLSAGLFLFLGTHRKRRRVGNSNTRCRGGRDGEDDEEYAGKPELEGSSADPLRLVKAELDASAAAATRAELPGSGGDEVGAGINVVKPELQGSPGRPGLLGVYVKRKAELEASVITAAAGIRAAHTSSSPGASSSVMQS